MARTAEIVFLAVLVFMGSAVTMSLGALIAWGAIIRYPNWTSPAGGVFGYYLKAASIIVIGLGGWALPQESESSTRGNGPGFRC
jgi:hypothetical protein